MSLGTLLRTANERQAQIYKVARLCIPQSATDTTAQWASSSSPPLEQSRHNRSFITLSSQGSRQQGSHQGQALPQASPAAQSANPEEIRKFAELANEWWNPQGPFRPLHAMNPVRCKFMRQALCECFGVNDQQAEPFKGLSFLDVGCGGGILTEALARMGATVTGIEPQHDNISAAMAHAQGDPVVAERTTYLAITAEKLSDSGAQFDAVMGLEIIEHVDEPQHFLKTLSSLTKSDGALFISTINRTPRGYAVAILGAEYIARIVPRGTHDWTKFVTPEELFMLVEGTGMELEQVAGMVMNPLNGNWTLSTSTEVNYIAYFNKTSLADRLQKQRHSELNSQAADLASA